MDFKSHTKKLERLSKQSQVALESVFATIDKLRDTNNQIDETIADINIDIQDLNVTAEALATAKAKNATVISNFKTMVGEAH